MVSSDVFLAANERGRRQRKKTPPAVAARYDRSSGRVVVSLSSGVDISFLAARRRGARERHCLSTEPDRNYSLGLGIHFPKLDADLYLPALLEGVLGSRKWMAAKLGAMGGRSTSVPNARLPRPTDASAAVREKRRQLADAQPRKRGWMRPDSSKKLSIRPLCLCGALCLPCRSLPLSEVEGW